MREGKGVFKNKNVNHDTIMKVKKKNSQRVLFKTKKQTKTITRASSEVIIVCKGIIHAYYSHAVNTIY